MPSLTPTPSWTLDHIGIAVHNLDDAIQHYNETVGAHEREREVVTEQGVELVFLDMLGTTIELIAPLHETSSVASFLRKRGEGLHHVCYRVEDIVQELDRLDKSGFRLIHRTPRPGANKTRIAFIHPASCHGVLTEICEYSRR